jgi:hypothetical protein
MATNRPAEGPEVELSRPDQLERLVRSATALSAARQHGNLALGQRSRSQRFGGLPPAGCTRW